MLSSVTVTSITDTHIYLISEKNCLNELKETILYNLYAMNIIINFKYSVNEIELKQDGILIVVVWITAL